MTRFAIINGKIIQKPSTGKKIEIEQQNQEAPMNLEDFDYDILEMPIAEDILV